AAERLHRPQPRVGRGRHRRRDRPEPRQRLGYRGAAAVAVGGRRNGTSVSTIYTANGTPQPRVVSVPSKPTGVVANSTLGFPVAIGSTSGPALFIFDTEEGKILGWNPNVALTQAIVVHRSRDGAIYKGLAMGSTATGTFLYAADFHNGKIDVFDTRFRQVTIPGAFADPGIPQRYAPFNIQNIGGELFVSYAKRDPLGEDEVAGPGLGFVDEYDTGGRLLMRVGSHDLLNAPWGLALAPVNFGRFGSDLLVGNFGDGRIIAYAPKPDGTFAREGVLRQPDGKPVEVDGLWALQFGLSHRKNGPTDTLFFTAGPDDEGHGLFGTIRAGTS